MKSLILVGIGLGLFTTAGCDKLKSDGRHSAPLASMSPQAQTPRYAHLINYIMAFDKAIEIRAKAQADSGGTIPAVCNALEWRIRNKKGVLSDFSDLPADFRSAYFANIKAWEAVLAELRSIPQGADLALLGLANLFSNGQIGRDAQIRQQEMLRQVQATNSNLEAAAINNGARIDWGAFPYITKIMPGSHAERLGVIQPGWFFLSYNGTSYETWTKQNNTAVAAREAAKQASLSTVEVTFLTPNGVVTKTVPGGELLGIEVLLSDE